MTINSIQVDWPAFSSQEHEDIISELLNYKSYATSAYSEDTTYFWRIPTDDMNRNFINLRDWPNKENFCRKLFKVCSNEYMPFLTGAVEIQQSQNHLFPHYDVDRKFSIVYVIEGAGAETSFYKKINEDEQDNINFGKYFLYNEVTKLETYKYNNGSWYTLNNSVIHGVKNYNGVRFLLVLDISNPIFNLKDHDDLIKNLPIIQNYFNRI